MFQTTADGGDVVFGTQTLTVPSTSVTNGVVVTSTSVPAPNDTAEGKITTATSTVTEIDVAMISEVPFVPGVIQFGGSAGPTVSAVGPYGTTVAVSAVTEVAPNDALLSVNVFCGAFRTTDQGGPLIIGNESVFCFAVSQADNPYTLYEYERPYELIKYTDNGNNMYSILLESKKVNNVRLIVTDSFGRLWPEISAAQIECNAMPFTASLRIDVFQE